MIKQDPKERMGEIRERLEAATGGPWEQLDDFGCIGVPDDHVVCFGHDYDEYGGILKEHNQTFIVNAPSDIAFLLEILEV